MELPNTIRLRDVARQAGVSVMTVSRALRNQSTVAPETRQRIQEIARRLGYRPNPMITALMRYRRTRQASVSVDTIGLVTNFTTRDGWRNVIYNQHLHEGVKAAADHHGYKVEEFWLREPKMTATRMSQILFHRNIHGLIIAPLAVANGHLRLRWDRVCAVTMGYSLVWPALHRAAHHQFRSMRLAIRRLRKRGYKRFGLAIRASSDERVDHHWVGGFLAEQCRARRHERFSLLMLADRDWKPDAFKRWYKRQRPEVILSLHPQILDWLRDFDTAVPNDVGFVHLNCPDQSGTFAGIYQNGQQVGSATVDLLVGMLERNESGIPRIPEFVLVDGTWQDGSTLL
jgi:LacI family transcriptional regulator